jgi:hypothetical protein
MPDTPVLPIFVYPFSHSKKILGSSDVCNYLNNYLKKRKTKTVIIENEYVDKDFMIDYSNFYSRAFKPIKKTTTRYHFFNQKISSEEFFSGLSSDDTDILKNKLKDSYLGFVIKKPIESANPLRYNLVGRTLLETYDKRDGAEERVYVKDSYNISLCGIPLTVESLPYQQHDFGVGACATTACWISLFPLSKLFGIPTLSPSEVTEKSVFFPSDCRNFPSDGLTIHQMKTYFNSMGLETEIIKPNDLEEDKNYDIVADIVKAYIQMNIPIIAGLAIVPKNLVSESTESHGHDKISETFDHHAVVISGYRHHKRVVKELYVHDDAFGPYCYIEPVGNFTKWQCRWPEYEDSIFLVNRLLIPIYPKIRLNFSFIYAEYQHLRNELDLDIHHGLQRKKTSIEFLLFEIKKYKNFLLDKKIKFLTEIKEGNKIKTSENLKIDFLTKSLPHFIWVIRYNYNGLPEHDRIYDGTDTLPNLIGHINYNAI